MKNIKILETIAVCLISFLLFSFAVVQEKSAQANPNAHAAVQQTAQAKQSTVSVSSSTGVRSSLNAITYGPFFKVISFIVVFVVIVSLIIIIIGFYFYNVYSIRP